MASSTLFMQKVKVNRGQLILSLLIILSAVLAACGSGGTTSTTSNKNSTLVLQANQSGDYPKNYNPYSGSVIGGTQGLIYETLLSYNRLDGSIKPWLASDYKVASDATSVTFTIRKGVKWSDGQALTSDDVVFTLQLIQKYQGLDVNGMDSYIKSVVAPDASTVAVTLTKPYFPILWYLGGQTYIVPRHTWSKIKGDPSQYGDPDPIGTGPYVTKNFTPQLVTLTKNKNYWQPGKPEVTTIKIPAFNSNSGVELALEHGQIDWTNLYIQNVEKSFVARSKDYHYWYPTSDIVYLYLNLKKAPFNQLAVRQAISAAIDRDQLNTAGEGGYEPAATPTGLLPTNSSYLLPEYKGLKFTYNPSQTASTLESIGYTKGSDGIYQKNGKQLAFNLNVVSGFTDWINDAQLMSRSLNKAGMKVTVNTIDYNTYYNNLQLGDYDTAMLWTNPGPTPYYLYNALLGSTNTAPIGQLAASNYERWSDPATDKLLNQYSSTTDKTVQMQAIQGLQKILVEQLPSIPLTYEPYWYQYSTAKFTGWPTQSNPYAAPGTAEYPDIEYVILNLHPVN
ncbi:ABC transporter substrate-binding protein [Dictyobacter arantiisoli]|uniref:Peptide ABC transporter substrate-binding protein n=1 Tax=Dictyobacter arantiisoli TaxID=2014874 RepID=A0A5A5TAY2_9CHLR|nr:ABC transporter substrate-binding protein [Dictyobacter arantiisoli]GCF08405.1 peptide ABC transporter substrate-binding protein [Dictyobacter arantiisoli]